MENNDKKNKIIETLKTFGKLPTGKLAVISGINYDYIKDILSELETDGLIICEHAGDLATYWMIKDGKEI